MSWIYITRSTLPGAPFALVDQRGRLYCITNEIQLATSMREILTRALARVVSGADTCPTLIHSGLTHADGSLTPAGMEWVMHTADPSEQLPN